MARRDRKQEILERHRHRCVYCGEQFDAAELTVDHVQPRMRGGDNSRGNLVACCQRCNAEKAGRPAWAFLAARPVLRENFLRYARWIWPRLRRAVEEAPGSGEETLPPRAPSVYDRGSPPMSGRDRAVPRKIEPEGTR